MIKKILTYTGILILLLIIAAIVLPIIFKDDIVKIAKEEAGNNMNAKLDFGDFSLSMFSDFPDFTLSVEDVSIVGIDRFKGDTLADIGELSLAVDLMSIMGGMDPIKVNSIAVKNAKIHVIVTKDGKANWDIAKQSTDTTNAAQTESGAFHLTLNEYSIEHTNIIYSDTSMSLFADIKDFNHTGSGDFTEDIFTFKTKTDASAMSVVYAGIPYLNSVEAEFKVDLDMDMPKMKFTFSENEIRLNQLFMGIDGFIEMPDDDIGMDIKFNASKTDFKNILSLIPAVFKKDFESVETSGKLALNGFVKGTYTDDNIPGFGINMSVTNAMFKYPDLPKSVKNIHIELDVKNPGGSTDQTVIDLEKFHADVAGQPLNARLHLTTPVSDPNINMNIKSQLNLANLKDIIPLEKEEQYNGSLTADIELKGKLSAIEKEHYEDFHAAGKLIVLDMKYVSADLPYDVLVKKMYLNFAPQFVELSSLDSKLGKNDISANGKILNLLGWYFNEENLSGTFNLNSRYMDINSFMTEKASAEDESEAGTSEISVLEVPENLDFILRTEINKLIYENLDMSDVSGSVIIKDGVATLKTLKMKALDGSLIVNGIYSTQTLNQPVVDFNVDISHVDIKKTYDTFESIQQIAPIAKHCNGKISTDMKFVVKLDNKMEPQMNTLTGDGHLKTDKVIVHNAGVMSKIADVLKMEQYRKLNLDNVNFTYEFKDGRVFVDPFDMPTGHGKTNVAGSNGFDQTLSYIMQMDLPTTDIGTSGMSVVNGLVSQANKAGANFSVGNRVSLGVNIGGTVLKPIIQPHYGKISGNPEQGIKDVVKDKVNEVKEEVKDESLKKLKEQTDKIMKEAEAQANKVRAEAKNTAEKIRKEGYANAQKIEDQAKNPLAKIAAKKTADKLRAETDKKADDIIKEGNNKADGIMNAARKKTEQLK